MMQDSVDVVEDVPLGNVPVMVVRAEFVERPVGDVLAAVGAIFVVGVEGETLKAVNSSAQMQVNYAIGGQGAECAS